MNKLTDTGQHSAVDFNKIRKNKFLHMILIFAFSTLGVIVRLVFFKEMSWEANLRAYLFSTIFLFFLWYMLGFINRYLNKTMPYEDGLEKRIAVQVLLSIITLSGVRTIIYFFIFPLIPFSLEIRLMIASYIMDLILTFAINAGYFGWHFFDEWRKSTLDTERLRKERAQVQFDNLKNHLNPHFLFNSLTSLNSLIFADQQLASQFLQQLSKVYRYVLQNKDKDQVSVATEVGFISHYISLLKTRFQENLHIEFNIEKEKEEKGIVPVSLQVLIENALKHNTMSLENPLVIKIYTKGEYLVVENSLQKRKVVDASNKIGLENMRNLYAFLSDKTMSWGEAPEYFHVSLPLL